MASLFNEARCLVEWNARGAVNMAWDAFLFEEAERSPRPAVLRIATWSPAAVSLGRFQDPERAVDASRARAQGYDIVRRPTGGRAVLHDGDVTYALVARRDDPAFGGPRAESLRAVGEALAGALASLGIRASLARGDAVRSARAADARPCFASASREEIRSGGRKLLGSARLEGRNAFLQQGSLPVRQSPAHIAHLLPAVENARARVLAEIGSAATCLDAQAGRLVAWTEIAEALRATFGSRACRAFRASATSSRERRAVESRVASFDLAPAAAGVASLDLAVAAARVASR